MTECWQQNETTSPATVITLEDELKDIYIVSFVWSGECHHPLGELKITSPSLVKTTKASPQTLGGLGVSQ